MENILIRINGVEQELPVATTGFRDFLNTLNDSLSSQKQVISCVRINGKEVTEAEEGALNAKSLSELGEIEIITSSPADLARETLTTLDQYVDRMITSIERAAFHYKAKSFLSGDAYFSKSIDALDLYVQTIGGVKMALRVGLNPKIALAEASLVSTMNDLLTAKRENNYVFVADLLEKDLVANLREWRNDIFPILRNWKAN